MTRGLDLDAVAQLLVDVAQAVHVPLFGQRIEAQQKAPGELVSEVDRTAERLLAAGLAGLTPGWAVVGEEAVAADPSLLRALQGEAPVWLLDPLDGTAAFLDGSPDHAVMVALVQAGEVLASVISQPQHRRTYLAERGAGAWRDGVRLTTSPAPVSGDLRDLRGAVLRRFLDGPARAAVDAAAPAFGDLTPSSATAGIEYPRLAEGDADFLLFWRTLPWDRAPGALLLREAGGAALRPDGEGYRVGDDRSGLLAAADRVTAERVLRGLGLHPG